MTVESNYQWLFRRSPALIVLLNEEGFFVDASDSWLKRFGYGREEITNMRPQDLATKEVAKIMTAPRCVGLLLPSNVADGSTPPRGFSVHPAYFLPDGCAEAKPPLSAPTTTNPSWSSPP